MGLAPYAWIEVDAMKVGHGNAAWRRALAKAISTKEFALAREAVMKMVKGKR